MDGHSRVNSAHFGLGEKSPAEVSPALISGWLQSFCLPAHTDTHSHINSCFYLCEVVPLTLCIPQPQNLTLLSTVSTKCLTSTRTLTLTLQSLPCDQVLMSFNPKKIRIMVPQERHGSTMLVCNCVQGQMSKLDQDSYMHCMCMPFQQEVFDI